jgi:putative hydrolase of the HAD superfamily
MIPAPVKAVVFDAVGTLIQPNPPADVVYAEVGQRYGSKLSSETIRKRFTAAFMSQELLDRQAGWRTSEEREQQRWRTIVAKVLDDTENGDRCFAELYEHFSRPEAWRVDQEGLVVARALLRRGYTVGLASNYDQRLRCVVGGILELGLFSPMVISAEVGWRKPAPSFFASLCDALRLTYGEVLYVGDDPDNDYHGANAAGVHAVLFDPGQKVTTMTQRIGKFEELLAGRE